MVSNVPTRCMLCGVELPAGITFRQVKDSKDQAIGARCYNQCRQPEKLECGHEKRFQVEPEGADKFCVWCVAQEAVSLGQAQAKEHDRFWEALGVLSADISVDQAIEKWKAMEAVLMAARDLRFKESTEVGHYLIHGVDLATLHTALANYDRMPKVEKPESNPEIHEVELKPQVQGAFFE